MRGDPTSDVKSAILGRVAQNLSIRVWTPNDFLDLGSRSGVDKALQRLTVSGDIRRIDRGLYFVSHIEARNGNEVKPDYMEVIEAIARRDKARLLPDGITAANQLGLTAIPNKVTLYTDVRLRAVRLGKLTIHFKPTAPSRLYWAGRPAMCVVQSLHWLRGISVADRHVMLQRIRERSLDGEKGLAIRADLEQGFHVLPGWMRDWVSALLEDLGHSQLSLFATEPRRRGAEREMLERQPAVRIAN